jgi:hypothetical protein
MSEHKGIFPRGSQLWMKVKQDGAWKNVRTGLPVGQEARAVALRALVQRELNENRIGDPGPLTVAGYLEQWTREREHRGVITASDDRVRPQDDR